jgi:hypothetical protein
MVRRSSVVGALVRSESTESDLQESVQVSADSEKTLPPFTDFLDRIVGTLDPECREAYRSADPWEVTQIRRGSAGVLD